MRLFCAFFILAALLQSCGQDATWADNAAPTEQVTVEALLYVTVDNTVLAREADTLRPTDTVQLSSGILPSRNIGITEFFWMVDSQKYPQVFSIRTAFPEGGPHRASFHLVDIFGDTLSDTVLVWTSTPPVFSNIAIPSANSWGIEPAQGGTLFAWECADPDPGDRTEFHFLLQNGNDTLLDTLLYTEALSLNIPLQPLQVYRWTVNAKDAFGMEADSTLTDRLFSTRGTGLEAGLYAKASLPPHADTVPTLLRCSSTTSNVTQSSSVANAPHLLSPLPAGTYKCWMEAPRWTDLRSDTVTLALASGQIKFARDLNFQDTIPPDARPLSTASPLPLDTVLRFLVRDGAPGSLELHLYWNGTAHADWTRKLDTLIVRVPRNAQLPVRQVLSLQAKDISGNSTWYTWNIAPSSAWIATPGDTLIQSYQNLAIKICNLQINHTPIEFLWDLQADGTWDDAYTHAAEDDSCAERVVSAGALGSRVRAGIRYSNDLLLYNEFQVQVNAPPAGVATLYAPGERTVVYRDALFSWAPATDPDGDSVFYRVEYLRPGSSVWANTPNTAGTTLPLLALPDTVGQFFWRVRSMDARGGMSAVYKQGTFSLEEP